jgi:hypothetical protein
MARVLVTPTITADFGTNPKGGTGGMPNIPVPAVPIIQVKETINETQDSVSIPEIIAEPDPNAPAKFAPLPAINLPSDDDDDEPSPSGIAFSGLPVIAVTSENVPEIHLGDVIPMPTRVQSDSAILCAGCGQPIIGRIVNAMKKRFHPQCFRCDECGENLEHVSSYEWEGRAYCHLDYHDVSTSSSVTLTTRNSHTDASTAKPRLSMLASSRSMTKSSANVTTMNYTSSARSAATPSSIPANRPLPVQNGPAATTRKPMPLSFIEVIHTASVVT